MAVGSLIRPFLPWILVAMLGGLLTYCAPVIGAAAKIRHLDHALNEAQRTIEERDTKVTTLESWLKFEREARKADSDAAITALDEERASCQIRIDQARRSSIRIEELIREEAPHDPTVCPDRRLFDPDRLREAIAGTGTGNTTPGH